MKIAILTNMMEMNPGYSLTGIIQDQIRMLVTHGHEVHLFVNEQFHGKGNFSAMPEEDLEKYGITDDNFKIRKLIPFAHLIDYDTVTKLSPDHKKTVEKTRNMLKEELKDFEIAFTHDFIFTGWFMPYGLACKEVSRFLETRWMHWIHSVPSSMRDWWDIRGYGPKHRIIFPNNTTRQQVVEQFRGWPDHMRRIHHIKDPRSWFNFDKETVEFIKKYPAVMHSNIVCVYPASVDRLHAKRVDKVIRIMAEIKNRMKTACLVIANQWATTRKHKQNIGNYKAIASKFGMEPDIDMIFTSDFGKQYEVGLPQYMIRNLFLLSNVFFFPTKEESFGLVLPEAGLSGCIPVTNKSLAMMMEVSGGHSLAFDFGSHHMEFQHQNEDAYLRDIAAIVISRFTQDESIRMKTFVRTRYNWDHLYNTQYLPIMKESKEWK